MRIIPLLILFAGLPAIAAETAPEVPAAPTPAAAPPAASLETNAAPATPAATETAAAAPTATAPVAAAQTQAAVQEFKPPKGYKQKTREGRTVYCRNETPVGTRFPTEYCFTQVDLERIEKSKRSMQQDVSMRQRMCTTGAACGGG